MTKPAKARLYPPVLAHPSIPTTTQKESLFESFVEDIESALFNTTSGKGPKSEDYPNKNSDFAYNYDEKNDFYDYEKPFAAKQRTTPKDPMKDGAEMPRDMKTFWDKLDHSPTPPYKSDYDYNYNDGSPYDYNYKDGGPTGGYNDYVPYVRNNMTDVTDIEYVPSSFLPPPPWTAYVPDPLNVTTYKADESVTNTVTGYQVAHAIYMGAVALILAANLIMIIAILLQPRIRCRSATILLLNFFVIEVLLSIVDLVFTQSMLMAADPDRDKMNVALCLGGPWMLHILEAAQPVALFVMNVESITALLTPPRRDIQVGCKVAALLVIITWLFGAALASIFVMRSELIETFVVVLICYDSFGSDEPVNMHFLMGLLQLGGPIVVLIGSGVTLIAVVIRQSSNSQLTNEAKSKVRASIIVLLAVSFTYILVTVPVIVINAHFLRNAGNQTARAWIIVQVIRRIGALFFPAFWWSRPDVRLSIKQLPSRLVCKFKDPPRPSVLTLETDNETADLLPLELSDPQTQNQETYRGV